MKKASLKKLDLPDSPGVYFFKRGKDILYIGRATSLKDRVKSYFSSDLIVARGPRIVDMTTEATTVDYESTGSVLEAIILEANLIKKYQPTYNTKEKDDRSFNYVVITEEEFPRVLMVRGRNLDKAPDTLGYPIREVFGPYPQGSTLREVLSIVRKLFPYRDTCVVDSGKPCFNRQIGRCPGVCTGEISSKEYKKVIDRITLLFRGSIRTLKSSLEKDMNRYAKTQDFEKANEVKRSLFGLDHIQDIALIKDDIRSSTNQRGFRIEAYDIAHMSGKNTVGVMTVVVDGLVDKSGYRKFKIRGVEGNNDVANIKEVVSRRFGHPEWGIPDLIVIDGGKGQINAVRALLKVIGTKVPVVAVTKDERHRPKAIIGDARLAKEREADILLSNSEAHRYAIKYHSEMRRKGFLRK
jgi:excinuclease ABC subunit C